jgi:hypothetical protein
MVFADEIKSGEMLLWVAVLIAAAFLSARKAYDILPSSSFCMCINSRYR